MYPKYIKATFSLLTPGSVCVQEVVGAVDGLSAARGETLACPEEGVRTRLVTIKIRKAGYISR